MTEDDEEFGMFMTRLRTIDPPQEFLGGLRTAELFVVSSLRLWVLSHGDEPNRWPDWRQGFVRAGISPAGAMGFDAVCCILVTTTLRGLDIRPLHCARLGVDELGFLTVIAMLQRHQVVDASSLLGGWCPPSAVRLALPPAQAIADALIAARLRVRARYEQGGKPLSAAPTPTSTYSSRLH